MNIDELNSILKKGECSTIEFKKAQGGVPKSLYETVVSFSNTDGGVIVLGADDDGHVLAIDPGVHLQYINDISATLHNQQVIDPPLYLNATTANHSDGDVIVLRVPASSQLHKYAGRVYWRSADNDLDVTGDQAKISDIYLSKKSYFSERIIYPFLKMDDLDPNLLSSARSIIAAVNSTHPWLTMDDQNMLASASLFRRDFKTGEEGFTLAAALIFGKDDTIAQLIPGYKVEAMVRRDNLDRYDDRLTLRTNLIDTYLQLLDFIKKHLNEQFYTEGGQRKDLRELIFREIIGNLIVHREYTNALSSELIIYKDKVVTSNPNKALFHGFLDLDQFNPYPKNPNIRKFFTAFGWTDEIGSGVRNTTKYLALYAKGAKPIFMENDIFSTELPLAAVSLDNYAEDITSWFDFSDVVRTYLKKYLREVPLDMDLNGRTWDQLLLHLVPSWTEKGTKLTALDWPKSQVSQPEDIKKVPGWAEKGTKLLHKKTSYLVRILLLTIHPISLDLLMNYMDYKSRRTFRDNYLKPLQKAKFIRMTKPDTPSAPDQAYIITEKGKRFLAGRKEL